MNRIESTFKTLKSANKKAFIGYITAGDPTVEHTLGLLKALEKGGCDIIEIGIPFSDPLADGPVIQAAGQRALEGGINVGQVFEVVEAFRKESQVPLAFLVYTNTIVVYGKERFIQTCANLGVDALIVPDLPYEERDEIYEDILKTDIALIPFASPTSKERLNFTLKDGKGFVYCVSSMGVTGRDSEFHKDLESYVAQVRANTDLPIAIGFGISTKEDVSKMAALGDAVIVGTAIVRKVEEGNGDPQIVEDFVRELASGC